MQVNSDSMPQRYSKGDEEWIQEQLSTLPPSARQKAIARYGEVYEEFLNSETVSFRKENKARHEANIRLREYVRKYHRALQGYTEKPPSFGQ
ncbi:hypothetical protein PO486_05650 [Atlantibacter hermannii]|uniref:hypothetical protein n=1 Tax=Atlantibacter hermannii TaxID=565 RepID=UPI0028AD22E4|nr:hypothetical protein [Atlantibacter hermannii]